MADGRTLTVTCRRYDTRLTVHTDDALYCDDFLDVEHNSGPLHTCRQVVDNLRDMLILHQPDSIHIRVESDSMAAGLTAGAVLGACHRDLLMEGVHIGVTYPEVTPHG